MNLTAIKEYLMEFLNRWAELKPLQKIAIGTALLMIPIVASLIILATSTSTYVTLYSPDQLRSMDISKLKGYLDILKIPYKISDNNTLLVPKNDEEKLRMELALYGLPKMTTDKGYELFDSTTWIKGEKELQILELRAVMGQIEQDLAHFENVRSANVVLDIPPARTFGGASYKAKASVILDLVPGTRLSPQELRAITFQVSAAVRGLTPNMVAISDTTGRLYQGLDYDGSQDLIRNSEIATEEYIKAKIDGMLSTIVGFNNYYTNVQVTMNRDRLIEERKIYSGAIEGVNLGRPVLRSITTFSEQQPSKPNENPMNSSILKPQESSSLASLLGQQQSEQLAVPVDYMKITSSPGKISAISIGVLIDESVLATEVYPYQGQFFTSGHQKHDLKDNIENQLSTLLKGYDVKVNQAVDFVLFDRSPQLPPIQPKAMPAAAEQTTNTFLVAIITIVSIAILFMLFRLQSRPRYIPSIKERENYMKQAEQKSLTNLEEMLDNIRARFHNNPSSTIGTLRSWMQEDKT